MMGILGRRASMLANDARAICGNAILVNATAYRGADGRLLNDNWGDDINWHFLREVADRPIVLFPDAYLARRFCPNYLCIGSVIAMLGNERSVVWGSGLLSEELPAGLHLKEVRAVRGPLTRQALLNHGIDCPEVYGDPALLLPLHYRPKVEKKHKLGIIPHYVDYEILERYHNLGSAHLIKVRGYGDWHDFIDEILSCERVISTSLHGLIVAEAYGVPSKWIEFDVAGRERKDPFKYNDFYASIGKEEGVLMVSKDMQIDDIIDKFPDYKKAEIDLSKLIAACPFSLKFEIDEGNRN